MYKLVTKEEVDTHAQDLSREWGVSFNPAPKFEGKKKNKLRDVICRLGGYPGGYQSFLKTLPEPVVIVTKSIRNMTLPSRLIVRCDLELDRVYVYAHTDATENAGDSINPLMVEFIGAIFDEDDEAPTTAWKPLAEESIDHSPLWQEIRSFYTAISFDNHQPSIEKYGVYDESTLKGAREFLESISLPVNEVKFDVDVHDTGSDGSPIMLITLELDQTQIDPADKIQSSKADIIACLNYMGVETEDHHGNVAISTCDNDVNELIEDLIDNAFEENDKTNILRKEIEDIHRWFYTVDNSALVIMTAP
tara:strand:- start:2814 stop:3731 length:918 start_codon:yes stop_codon:yes gene_type:complete